LVVAIDMLISLMLTATFFPGIAGVE
jgi:hypothetical protein